MKKVILALTLLLIPSVASAQGYAFALKKEPYIQPDSPQARGGRAKVTKASAKSKQTANCDPSYPTICLRSGAPDLDCRDIGWANFRVVGKDPHRFDRDGDGVGCEASMPR